MPQSMFSRESAIWSAELNEPTYSLADKGLGVAVGLAAFTGASVGFAYGVNALQKDSINKVKPFDLAQRAIRDLGYNSPFQLLNTFRIPEFMSPYISNESKMGLERSGKNNIYTFSSEVLNEATRIQIKQEFTRELSALDIDIMNPVSNFEITYEGATGKSTGSIYISELGPDGSPGQRVKITDGARLQETVPYEAKTVGKASRASKVNPVAYSRLQTNGTINEYRRLGMDVDSAVDTLYGKVQDIDDGKVISGRSRYMLIRSEELAEGSSVTRKASTLIDKIIMGAGQTAAFSMQRLNNLLETATDHLPILGKVQRMASNIGLDLKIESGRPHEMFMNFGIKGAKIMGAATVMSEMDHWRRELGVVGNFAASATTAAAATWGLNKILKDSGTGFKAKFGLGVFAAQMILPGFNQGIVQGLYTNYNNLQMVRSAVGEFTLMNSYRRTVEGIAPGASSIYTGAFAGFALMGASAFGVNPLANRIYESMSNSQKYALGIRPHFDIPGGTPKDGDYADFFPKSSNYSIREYHSRVKENLVISAYQDRISSLTEELGYRFRNESDFFKFTDDDIRNIITSSKDRRRAEIEKAIRGKIESRPDNFITILDELHAGFEKALVDRREAYIENNQMNDSLIKRIKEIETKYEGKTGFGAGIFRKIEEFQAQAVHSFFGASMMGENFKEALKTTQNYKPNLGRLGTLFAAGVIIQQIATGGLLGTLETPGELSDIYSGRKLVPIKKSRFWEGGGTPIEGTEIDYYRPHHYVSFMARTHEKSVWGQDAPSPIAQFFLKNFTYEMERRNYYDRPYPITSGAFEDVPVIGKLLAATIGRVFKPPKLMHTSEFMRENSVGNIEFLHDREYGMSYELGGQTPGKPMSPFEASAVAGFLHYQFRELEGMTGWGKNMLQQATTGSPELATDRPIMESAGRMDSINDRFWDSNIGGGFLTTEPIRRFLPRKRSRVTDYNPIVNSMPSWLPAKFHRGDPYRKVEAGTIRLPGAGYEAIHPELKGLSPENYPDIYKYAILGDVADTSLQFKKLQEQLYRRRARGTMSEKEIQMMDDIDQMVSMKSQDMTNLNIHPNAYEIPVISGMGQAAYQFGTRQIRKGMAPIEYMVPMGFRPTQKLLYNRDPIEQYEYERLYGTQFSFWDKPFRDWFRPALYSSANLLGYTGVPEHREKSNEINQYFDELEFLKQMQLANQAGSKSEMYKHLYAASRTRYGTNPQGSALSIYDALPREEKKFFDAFAAARGSDRERIKEMVAPDIAALYENIWRRLDSGKSETLTQGRYQELDQEHLYQRYNQMMAEGLSNGGVMPGEDFVGYRDDVSLNDIKVRYSDRLAVDLHDVGMFDKSRRELVRKDYLQGSENILLQNSRVPGSGMMTRHLYSMRGGMNAAVPAEMYVNRSLRNDSTNIYYNDNRQSDIREAMRREF